MILFIAVYWLTHVMACLWYVAGLHDEVVTYGENQTEVIYGWVNEHFQETKRYNLTNVDMFRRYLVSFHAVNPKMVDLGGAWSVGEFTNRMLVSAIFLAFLLSYIWRSCRPNYQPRLKGGPRPTEVERHHELVERVRQR